LRCTFTISSSCTVRPPPSSTLFPTRRSSDLVQLGWDPRHPPDGRVPRRRGCRRDRCGQHRGVAAPAGGIVGLPGPADDGAAVPRSEEHTSELQSRENLVCRLLLEKKKKYIT